MKKNTHIVVRCDLGLRASLEQEAQAFGRSFSDHVRRKLEHPEEAAAVRFERVERKLLFCVLAIQRLFEGLDRGGEIDAVMDAVDQRYDPLEIESDHASTASP